MDDDHDRPHYVTRDLEDLEDLDGASIFDARALDDDEPSSPTHAEPDTRTDASEGSGDPEPREGANLAPAYGMPGVPETWPQDRRERAMPPHERRPLPQRMRRGGIACVVVLFSDGRKVVLR